MDSLFFSNPLVVLLVLVCGGLGSVGASDLGLNGLERVGVESSESVREVRAWEGLFRFPNLRVNTAWLTRASKWIDEGGELITSGTRTIYKKNGDEIFEVKNGSLLGNQKQHYDLNRAGTPVGDPVGGYQVVKVGDDVKLRRAPDEAPYAGTNYQTRLNEHLNAHVLERHGHDVTDDALLKRADKGIAPDGSTIGSNTSPPFPLPPYSSKFGSSDALKQALDNTGPGTTTYQNALSQASGSTFTVTHRLTSGLYGKGVAKNSTTFQNMSGVKAVFRKRNGNWELLTMYPEL